MNGDRKRRSVEDTVDYAVDLISSRRQRARFSHSISMERRESVPAASPLPPSSADQGQPGTDFVLPKWQPDTDVDVCPICDAPFTFLYRKHHCRKCGRVVCWKCSPHRITIPQKYVVQPPGALNEERATACGDHDGSHLQRVPSNLGAVVRVCNPCVPDPWTPGVGQEALSRPTTEEQGRRDSRDAGQLYRAAVFGPPIINGTKGAQPSQTDPALSRSVPQTLPPWRRDQLQRQPPVPQPTYRASPTHRYSRSNVDSRLSPVHPDPSIRLPALSALPPVLPRPRRKIREEDECPVCGTELPPGDRIRETHVQACIEARFFTHAASPPRSAPPANAQPPPAATSASTPPTADSSTLAESSRPRAKSYRPRGMALYRATEKDCTTEDGEPQECIICFEEFQPGEEMGRMECLCKFHRGCIRAWWDTKGVGSCPTHQLHD